MEENFYASLDHIDLQNGEIITKEVSIGDAEAYIDELLKDIMKETSTRRYTKNSDTTEVISILINAFNSKNFYDKATTDIAQRFLNVEMNTDRRYKGFTDIKKGSLLQFFLLDKDYYTYIITKVEHTAYLDETDLKKRIGLPFEKRVLKTCVISFNNKVEIEQIIAFDSNSKISTYWWSDFLELRELTTDETNTKAAYDEIELYLTKKVKKISPYDYTNLMNNTLGYFKTQENFVLDNMINTVFGSYDASSEMVKIEDIKNGIRQLAEKGKFDKNFTLKPKMINARPKKYKLNENIELNLNGHIQNIDNVIKSGKEPNGDKYIKIITNNDEVFKMFKQE